MNKDILYICEAVEACEQTMCSHKVPHTRGSGIDPEEDLCNLFWCGNIGRKVKCIPLINDWDN